MRMMSCATRTSAATTHMNCRISRSSCSADSGESSATVVPSVPAASTARLPLSVTDVNGEIQIGNYWKTPGCLLQQCCFRLITGRSRSINFVPVSAVERSPLSFSVVAPARSFLHSTVTLNSQLSFIVLSVDNSILCFGRKVKFPQRGNS